MMKFLFDAVQAATAVLLTSATITLAFVTYGLVERTSKLADEARKTLELAESHHQEGMSGILIVEGIRMSVDGDPEIEGLSHIRIEGVIKNVGPGISFDARVNLQSVEPTKLKGGPLYWDSFEVGSLRPGMTKALARSIQCGGVEYLYLVDPFFFTMAMTVTSFNIFKESQVSYFILRLRKDERFEYDENISLPKRSDTVTRRSDLQRDS